MKVLNKKSKQSYVDLIVMRVRFNQDEVSVKERVRDGLHIPQVSRKEQFQRVGIRSKLSSRMSRGLNRGRGSLLIK